MRHRAGVAAIASMTGALALGALWLVVRAPHDLLVPSDAMPVRALPPPVRPEFTPVARPVRITRLRDVSRWAPVRSPVVARTAPSANASSLERLGVETPEGTTNIVLALGHRRDRDGNLWIHVRLPILPNDRTGWIPRRALGGYATVRTRLVVDLSRLAATLYKNGRRIFSAPVGVGMAQSPTPTGDFYIRNELHDYRSPFYGPVAFGTSARSRVLTDWPAGGFIGIHGTNEPQLIPGRVSHGCIRMRDHDISMLARLMPIGTPLTIRP